MSDEHRDRFGRPTHAWWGLEKPSVGRPNTEQDDADEVDGAEDEA